jgi:hypothetical protein
MEQRGLIASLFDRSFSHLVTLKLVKGFYYRAMILVVFLGVIQYFWLAAVTFDAIDSGFLALLAVVTAVPLFVFVMTLLALMLLRIACEFLILAFRMSEYLRSIEAKLATSAESPEIV